MKMNQKKTLIFPILFLTLSVVACSTASVRLMPGASGVHKVLARDIEIEGAEEAAHNAAVNYCEDKQPEQEAVFLKEKSKYTGKMDEDSRKGVRAASRAFSVIPGGFIIGAIGNKATDDRDYKAGLLFRCREVTK